MKILLSSDFHSDFSRLIQIAKKVDLCICCGDILDYHKLPSKTFKFPIPFFSIRGNKELWGDGKLQKNLESYGNFFWLNENLRRIKMTTGLHFYGIDYLQEPNSIPSNTDILISHQPAFGLADQCSDPFHARMVPHCGSKTLKRLIDLYPPKYLISGHIHYYQTEKNKKTIAVTLPPALIDPVIVMNVTEGKISLLEIKK